MESFGLQRAMDTDITGGARMTNEKKGIAYQFYYIFLVLIFISLDSVINIPYAHILRWICPMAFLFAVSRRRGKLLYPKGVLWLGIAGMFLLASIYSFNIKYSFGRYFSYLIMTCFFFMFYLYQCYNHTFINIPYYFGKMFIIYEIANFFVTLAGDWNRASGITGNANSLGIWSNIAFVFSVYYIKIAKKYKIKSLYTVTALMSVYTAIASGSRTYTICILLNIAICFMVIFRSKIKYLALVPVLLFSCISITSIMKALYQLPGFQRLVEEGSSRGAIWEAGISLWRQKPLLGWGYGINQELNSIKYLGYIPGYGDYGFAFHNSYLSVLIEVGVIGLSIVLLHYLIIMLRGLKAYRKTKDITMFTVIWLCINMLLCFVGSSAMISLGSTEGFVFWGLLMWIYVYTTCYNKI